MFKIRCSVFDIRCSVFDIRCSVFDIRCSVFDVQNLRSQDSHTIAPLLVRNNHPVFPQQPRHVVLRKLGFGHHILGGINGKVVGGAKIGAFQPGLVKLRITQGAFVKNGL